MRLARKPLVALTCVAQLLLVGLAMGDRLSARFAGEEYFLRVAPLDPIDPFRGAYVALSYPDIQALDPNRSGGAGQERDEVFIPLVRDGEVWRGEHVASVRPSEGPYLSCSGSDWVPRCGIESFFVPQEKARALEASVRSGNAVARIRIDSRGNAVVVGIDTD